ncbi:MAG: hypothetical protein JXA96_07490 [Sedimentisphaerales bacterium]|nr:hypothetical protein [Sedimentisphaerales bacterium]
MVLKSIYPLRNHVYCLCLLLLSSCTSMINIPLEQPELEKVISQNIILMDSNDFQALPSSLVENEIIFLGEIHNSRPLITAASHFAVYLANQKPVVYALEACYGSHPLFEEVSLGGEKQINPDIYTEIIRTFNSNKPIDKKIMMTALDLEHAIYHTKAATVTFLKDLAQRSNSDNAIQYLDKEIGLLTVQNTYDKMDSYLNNLKNLFQKYFDTFPPDDRKEINFSFKLLKASNLYQYIRRGLKNDHRKSDDIRYKYFTETIKRAYHKAKQRDSILICRIGNWHLKLDNKKGEARYFAKKYSKTKGKVAAIRMVPIYENAENNKISQDNIIDSIAKNLMEDCQYSYLSLHELKKAANNSFKWNEHFSKSGPKYDAILFVKVKDTSNSK